MENEQVEIMKAPQLPSRTETTNNLWNRSMKRDPVQTFTTPCPQAPSTSSTLDGGVQVPRPYTGLGTAIAAELMISFWFGIGVVLAVKTLESLEYCISRKC